MFIHPDQRLVLVPHTLTAPMLAYCLPDVTVVRRVDHCRFEVVTDAGERVTVHQDNLRRTRPGESKPRRPAAAPPPLSLPDGWVQDALL